MKRWDYFMKLRRLSPELAKGKTRARTEELKGLITLAETFAVPASEPSPVVATLALSEEEIERLQHTLIRVSSVRHVLAGAPIPVSGIAKLVVMAGHDKITATPEQVETVLNTFLNLDKELWKR